MSEAKMKDDKRKVSEGFHLQKSGGPSNEGGMRSGKMSDGKKDGKKSMKDCY